MEDFPTPKWVHDAVFYHIFPERFANGDVDNDPPGTIPWASVPHYDTFMGGDLQGVLDRIDYLLDLGITAVYFNPLFMARSNHKFDHGDYRKIDPHFGTNDLMKQLVRKFHRHGLKVILDISHNHSGREFFAFADVVQKGVGSDYKDWYHFESFPVSGPDKPNYKAWWGFGTLPEFNHDNPKVRAYFHEVTRYWMEEVGIDGWRLDVANEVPHDYWQEWRTLVKGINPDAYVVGEIWGDGTPWLQGDNFDAVMNYVWRDLVVDFFAKRSIATSSFDQEIQALLRRHPVSVNLAMFNLLGSHDTARFLTVADNHVERLQLAILYQFTYVGAPVIYYGDEIGMRGDKDPDCRGAMVWDRNYWNEYLWEFVRKCIHLRKSISSLRSPHYRRVVADDLKGVYIVARGEGDVTAYVILNNSPHRHAVAFCPDYEGRSSEAKDALNDQAVPIVDGMISCDVEPWGGRLLIRE